jgi:subtilisin family serine protease
MRAPAVPPMGASNGSLMAALSLVQLPSLMRRTSGRSDVVIGLLDGPVDLRHPHLASDSIRDIRGARPASCVQPGGIACSHGTFVAGILTAKRGSPAPALCPDCTLLVRPIFSDLGPSGLLPSTTPLDLAAAVVETVDSGARVINMSAALGYPSGNADRDLDDAFDYAAARGVLVVAAAGNQGTLGSSPITRHRWIIPVVACDLQGRPISMSNLGRSISRHGLSAPGQNIPSLGSENTTVRSGGTSVAAPFVTGAIALLWSEHPTATAVEIRSAVTQSGSWRRATVVPPLLNVRAAQEAIGHSRRLLEVG